MSSLWMAINAWAVGGNGSIYRYGLLEGFPAGGADILDVVIDEQVAPAIHQLPRKSGNMD
jgi:hypothetical protein